jgi:hypothetical protein
MFLLNSGLERYAVNPGWQVLGQGHGPLEAPHDGKSDQRFFIANPILILHGVGSRN